MKRTAFAVIFAFELLSLVLAGIQSVNVAHGNGIPFWKRSGPATPPPVISVFSPTSETYENEVLLHLYITVLDSHQSLKYVDYTLDEEVHQIYSEQRVLNYYKVLEGLSEGTHSLKVYASCKSDRTGDFYSSVYGSSSDVIYFTVVYPPVVSILSLENKVYKTNNIPLDFAVDEPASKIEYCIDGKERMVIDGNVTLIGLSNGLHSVTVYATDVDGNVGVSEAAYFEIEAFPTLLVLASVSVVAVIVGLGLLVYFIKRS